MCPFATGATGWCGCYGRCSDALLVFQCPNWKGFLKCQTSRCYRNSQSKDCHIRYLMLLFASNADYRHSFCPAAFVATPLPWFLDSNKEGFRSRLWAELCCTMGLQATRCTHRNCFRRVVGQQHLDMGFVHNFSHHQSVGGFGMLDFCGADCRSLLWDWSLQFQIFVAEAGIVAVEAVKHFLSVCQRNE